MSPLSWTVLTALAFAALPSHAANDNAPCVNGPLTKSCWEPDFDIHTDYTALIAPEGKVVEVGGQMLGWTRASPQTT